MLFKLLMFTGLLQQEHQSGLPFSLPVDRVLSELFTLTCSSWVTLHGVAHSCTELGKPLRQDRVVIQEEECVFLNSFTTPNTMLGRNSSLLNVFNCMSMSCFH